MQIRAFLFVSAILIFAFTSCQKDAQGKDFRDKFVGKYRVIEKRESYGSPVCGSVYSIKDTVIVVDYGITDSTLFVLQREVHLDEEGYYHNYHFGIRLWNDSIWSLHMKGGLGCGVYEIYEGKRISSKP